MHHARITIWLALWLGLTGLPVVAWAEGSPAQPEDPVAESARETLAEFPWYDASSDDLRRLDVEPPPDVKNRNSKWLFTPRKWTIPDWLRLTLKILAWATLVIIITAMTFYLAKAFMDRDKAFASDSDTSHDPSLGGDVDRVEALPFQLKRPQGDLLGEARRLYEEGQYAEAMIYLYSYQLVQLDKRHVIRLTRGKTNRQYLREVRRRSNLFDLMQQSMVMFEDVFFGNHPLGQSSFEACWTRLDEFHEQLDPEHALA